MADPGLRHIDIDSLVDDMRPPTDDDVPMTFDWQPLDTKDKLLAYLDPSNEASGHDRADFTAPRPGRCRTRLGLMRRCSTRTDSGRLAK